MDVTFTRGRVRATLRKKEEKKWLGGGKKNTCVCYIRNKGFAGIGADEEPGPGGRIMAREIDPSGLQKK